MSPKNMRNKLPLIAIGLAMVTLAGCELLVDFDRTKIDGGSLDGTTPDVTNDTIQPDVNTNDASDGSVNDAPNDVTDGSVSDVVTSDVTDASTTDADDGSAADADDGSADDGADE